MLLNGHPVSESIPSTLSSSPDIQKDSLRLSPAAQSLRHGTQHGSDNTWQHNSETRACMRVSTNNHDKDAIKPRSKSDSILSYPQHRFYPYAQRPMYGRPSPTPGTHGKSTSHKSTQERTESSRRDTNPTIQKRDLKRARKGAASLRDALFGRRLWLKERRNAVQEERTKVAEMEADLMNFVRQSFIESRLAVLSLARSIYVELESKRAALEAKRDELGALQYDYDQAEIDHNLKEAELDEAEQSFEKLLFETLGRSDSSEDDASSAFSNYPLAQPKSETLPSPGSEPDRAQFLASRLRTKSDGALAIIQHSFPKARPRINWWILHTFGCCSIDYVQRARDKAPLRELRDVSLDDEDWARLVFDYWRQGKEPHQNADHSDGSWAEVSSQKLPEPRHVRRFTVAGSYLLLSTETSKAQYTIDNYDLLFPSDPGFREDYVLQDDAVSRDLELLSHKED